MGIKLKIYRTWGRPYGEATTKVCEVSAPSKNEARKKFKAIHVVMDDETHIWKGRKPN